MELLVQFIEQAGELRELDLSWNNFRPQNFVELMNCLRENTGLRSLNLSWNLMYENADQREKSEYQYPTNKAKMFDKEDSEMTHSEIMASRFSDLIRFNKNMQHIDLTNTGISEVFLFNMLPALRRAKGLLAFHIGANPGVNKKI